MSELRIDPYYESKEWRELRKAVCQRDKHICQYCGSTGHQADHVIPRRKGGPDTMSNLVCACRDCNKIVMGSLFPSFEAKKAWILSSRGKPIPAPRVQSREKTYLLRKPPKRNSLRQRLADKHRPDHYREELLVTSQS